MMTRNATSLFSQIITLIIDAGEFRGIVEASKGDKHSKGLRCREQPVALLFLHLSNVTSLREITHGLRTVAGKIAHLGMKKVPGHSTLSYANAHRPSVMYRSLLFAALERFQSQFRTGTSLRFKNKLLSMDATTIDLGLSLFPWAKFRQTKGAVKVRVLLDHDGYFPVFAHITDGKRADALVVWVVDVQPCFHGAIDAVYKRRYTFLARSSLPRTDVGTGYTSFFSIGCVRRRSARGGGACGGDESVQIMLFLIAIRYNHKRFGQ